METVLGNTGLSPNVLMTAIALCISALVYRRLHWGKVAAPRGGCGHGFAVGDSEHPTGEDTGQPPLDRGAETGAAKR